jgi:hypothetical protein
MTQVASVAALEPVAIVASTDDAVIGKALDGIMTSQKSPSPPSRGPRPAF